MTEPVQNRRDCEYWFVTSQAIALTTQQLILFQTPEKKRYGIKKFKYFKFNQQRPLFFV
jgi:hypothetical protein